uniref:Uncharacterized protein n=1 Tax=Anguilla anguilla TaxID=7936 RepID=A0A0E9XYH1_ANGAN
MTNNLRATALYDIVY